jgi:hypothetical protein
MFMLKILFKKHFSDSPRRLLRRKCDRGIAVDVTMEYRVCETAKPRKTQSNLCVKKIQEYLQT